MYHCEVVIVVYRCVVTWLHNMIYITVYHCLCPLLCEMVSSLSVWREYFLPLILFFSSWNLLSPVYCSVFSDGYNRSMNTQVQSAAKVRCKRPILE